MFRIQHFHHVHARIVDGNVVKMRDLDNVFAAVNAVVRSGAPERKNKEEKSHSTSKSIVRFEFLEAVVRLGLGVSCGKPSPSRAACL